jgi:hypothetical protein
MKDEKKEVAGAHETNMCACARTFPRVHVCTRKCVQGRKQGKKDRKEGRKEGRDVPKLSHAGGTIF